MATGEDEDERDALIASRAMAFAGTVLILALTGALVFELARGHDLSPYAQLLTVGGVAFTAALLFLRRKG